MAAAELYDDIGAGYSLGRRTDPRWMTAILAALGDARSVADVGAGTGSYEPHDRTVLAIEPSVAMIRQRPSTAAPAVRAVAEALPVGDHAVDAALAVLTVHHWTDWRHGLIELRRTAPRQVVLAYDTHRHTEFWLVREYIPEIADLELSRPSAHDIANELGADNVTRCRCPGISPTASSRPTGGAQPPTSTPGSAAPAPHSRKPTPMPSNGACTASARTSRTADGTNNTKTCSTSTSGTPASDSSFRTPEAGQPRETSSSSTHQEVPPRKRR